MLKEKRAWFITGGAGFIGANIAKFLLKNGQDIIVYDNFSSGGRAALAGIEGKIKIIEGDVRDLPLMLKSMKGIDYVLHHAALISVPQSVENPALTVEINTLGSANVLDAALKNKVKRVVLASSSAVYGDGTDLPYSEKSPVSPLSPYALSKLQMEELAALYTKIYNLETVCLRYFNAYGPGQRADLGYSAVISAFIKAVKRGGPVFIDWDGLQSRDFINAGDIVRANIIAALEARAGGVYNIAGGRSASLLELMDIIDKISGRKTAREFRPKRGGDVRASAADITKIKSLGFEPRISLETGLKELFNCFKG